MLALLSRQLILDRISADADMILSETSLQPVPIGLELTWNLGFWFVCVLALCELGALLAEALAGGPFGGGGGALSGSAFGVTGVCIIDDAEALFGAGDGGGADLGSACEACCAAASALPLCHRPD